MKFLIRIVRKSKGCYNEPVKKILVISDMSCTGRASIMVAAPVLSALGLEAAALPTAVLSSQTGGIKDYTYLDMSAEIPKIIACWRKNGVKFDGIMTGYLGKPEIAELVPSIIEEFAERDAVVAVDPVLGDGGELYGGFDSRMVKAVGKLLPYADFVKPNQTELALLGGEENPLSAFSGLLKKRAVILESGYERKGEIGVRAVSSGVEICELRKKTEGFFHGAGDVFFSAFSGLCFLEKPLADAVRISVDFVTKCIEYTADSGRDTREGVIFEPFIKELIKEI